MHREPPLRASDGLIHTNIILVKRISTGEISLQPDRSGIISPELPMRESRSRMDRVLTVGARVAPMDCSIRRPLRFLLLALLLLLLFGGTASAQPGNLERLEECAQVISDSLLNRFPVSTPLCIQVARHPAAWVMEEALVRSATARGMRIAACDSGAQSSAGTVTLAITAIGMEYRAIDPDDSLERDARIEANAILSPASSGGASGERSVASYVAVRRDTVGADETTRIEGSGYDFAKGNVPTRSSSGIWKKLVEPAVVLGASVVMVILLFTVRSQ